VAQGASRAARRAAARIPIPEEGGDMSNRKLYGTLPTSDDNREGFSLWPWLAVAALCVLAVINMARHGVFN
jgi:hypothetical protein